MPSPSLTIIVHCKHREAARIKEGAKCASQGLLRASSDAGAILPKFCAGLHHPLSQFGTASVGHPRAGRVDANRHRSFWLILAHEPGDYCVRSFHRLSVVCVSKITYPYDPLLTYLYVCAWRVRGGCVIAGIGATSE